MENARTISVEKLPFDSNFPEADFTIQFNRI
jgi:hypothetical protein